jgi:hypothetical protein
VRHAAACTAALSAILPVPEQTWLLRACLLDGEAGREAWHTWHALAGDAKAAMVEDRWSVKRLLPALYVALRRNEAVVDATLLSYLRLAYVREQMRATTYQRICGDVVAVLAAADVPALLLRGGALAATVYDDPAVRHCHDLAFLVRPQDIPRAADALQNAGLTPLAHAPNAESPYAALRHETSLPVELHGRLFTVPMYELPWEELWLRACDVTIGGRATRVLSPADALLHVSCHAFSSASRESLRWVMDAWHILRRDGAVAWEVLGASAERGRLALPALVTLRYLVESLGAPVPAPVLDRLEAAVARAPVVERDVALRAVRNGACESVSALLGRTRGGWHVRALTVAWLLFPSRAYVRDVAAGREGAGVLFHYLERPINYLRRRSTQRTSPPQARGGAGQPARPETATAPEP